MEKKNFMHLGESQWSCVVPICFQSGSPAGRIARFISYHFSFLSVALIVKLSSNLLGNSSISLKRSHFSSYC